MAWKLKQKNNKNYCVFYIHMKLDEKIKDNRQNQWLEHTYISKIWRSQWQSIYLDMWALLTAEPWLVFSPSGSQSPLPTVILEMTSGCVGLDANNSTLKQVVLGYKLTSSKLLHLTWPDPHRLGNWNIRTTRIIVCSTCTWNWMTSPRSFWPIKVWTAPW